MRIIHGLCLLAIASPAWALVGDAAVSLLNAECIVHRTGEAIPMGQCIAIAKAQGCTPGGTRLRGLNGVIHATKCRPHDAARAAQDMKRHPEAYQRKCDHIAWTNALKAGGGTIAWPPAFCTGANVPKEWEVRQHGGDYAVWRNNVKLASLKANDVPAPSREPLAKPVRPVDNRLCAHVLKLPDTHRWKEGGAELVEVYCKEEAP